MTNELANQLSPENLLKLGDFTLMCRLAVEGFLAGIHRSLNKGFGGEFQQYRPYVPGDDLKYVDWKLYARQGRLNEKVYLEETDMRCALLVDASASMAYKGTKAPSSKYQYAALLAGCFTYLTRRQGDRAGLFVYNQEPMYATHRGEPCPDLHQLIKIFEGIAPAKSANHTRALDEAEGFLGAKRGMVILLSDLWGAEDQLEGIIRRLRFEQRDVIVCHILDNDELELPFDNTTRFIDSENGDSIVTAPPVIRDRYRESLQKHLDTMRTLCLNNQADYLLADTSHPFADCLAAYLNKRT
jgi:uncharacterized protein (DUF58 family)